MNFKVLGPLLQAASATVPVLLNQELTHNGLALGSGGKSE